MSDLSAGGSSEPQSQDNMSEIPLDSASGSASPSKPKRVMSTVEFPYNSLDSCLKLVEEVYEHVGRSAAQTDQVAAWLGTTMTSGTFKLRMSATRMFGLIAGERGTIQLTHLADRTLDPLTSTWARAQAFLNVELYRKLYEQNRGRLLAKSAGLEAEMVALGVSPNQKEKARQIFERSAREAGFFEHGADRLVEPTFIEPSSSATSADADEAESEPAIRPLLARKNEVLTVADDPLVQGLLSRMPAPEKGWPAADRARWLRTFAMNLSVIYGEEGGEVEIVVPTPKPD